MCANFFFRMCGALKEGIEVVIKGRASENYWRKFVGRREGARVDRGTREPPEMEQNVQPGDLGLQVPAPSFPCVTGPPAA